MKYIPYTSLVQLMLNILNHFDIRFSSIFSFCFVIIRFIKSYFIFFFRLDLVLYSYLGFIYALSSSRSILRCIYFLFHSPLYYFMYSMYFDHLAFTTGRHPGHGFTSALPTFTPFSFMIFVIIRTKPWTQSCSYAIKLLKLLSHRRNFIA